MSGLFQPMLDPNGTTNGIPNAAINAARQRANAAQGNVSPPQSPDAWLSPEELRARTGKLQSYGDAAPQMGMQPQGDMSVMQAQDPQMAAPMPTLNDAPESANGIPIPSYIGNPIVDKYIHQFIGGA